MNRRVTARFLATLVAEHRIDKDDALNLIHMVIVDQPRKVFNLYPSSKK